MTSPGPGPSDVILPLMEFRRRGARPHPADQGVRRGGYTPGVCQCVRKRVAGRVKGGEGRGGREELLTAVVPQDKKRKQLRFC